MGLLDSIFDLNGDGKVTDFEKMMGIGFLSGFFDDDEQKNNNNNDDDNE